MIDIDALAEKVGMKRDGEFWYSEGGDEFDVKHEHLVALMNLVAAAEREACATVVEQTKWSNWFQADCAAAIRARGQA